MDSASTFYSTIGADKMELVYTAPLKGAIRAIKIFSLTTAVATFFGGPVLVLFGNPSVPLVARVMMSSMVMLVGLGTTAILHWLVKGMFHFHDPKRQIAFFFFFLKFFSCIFFLLKKKFL